MSLKEPEVYVCFGFVSFTVELSCGCKSTYGSKVIKFYSTFRAVAIHIYVRYLSYRYLCSLNKITLKMSFIRYVSFLISSQGELSTF